MSIDPSTDLSPVCVIVPVYNAFAEAKRCIESVLEHYSGERVLVIDDASTEGSFRTYLGPLASDARLELSRNENNLGFVKTCNEGMRRAAPQDVVLLNSDTVVTAGWLRKLRAAALSSEQVGTVTPFTNNGTVCSVPKFFEENSLPPFLSLSAMAALIERVSVREYPVLPTCVGFCVYVRRALLDRVGLFDEETFDKGYGEENDLSLRGQAAGFIDILDDATFIYHEGSRSFSESRIELQRRNSAIISERYPDYFPAVQAYRTRNPLAALHERIHQELLEAFLAQCQAHVLHILHNGPTKEWRHNLGGTEQIVARQIKALPDMAHFSLVAAEGVLNLTAHLGTHERLWRLQNTEAVLSRIVEAFQLVHVHHTAGFQVAALSRVLRQHPRVVVSMHDHSSLCPRYYLLTPQGERCGLFQCQTACGFAADFVTEYREAFGEILRRAAAVIHFSAFSKEAAEMVYGALPRAQHIPHVLSDSSREVAITLERLPPLGVEGELRVAFVGTLAPHKGLSLAQELATEGLGSGSVGRPLVRLRCMIFGDVHGVPEQGPLTIPTKGAYRSIAQLRTWLEEFKPHVALFPGKCPETFGLTADEVSALGVPVVVGPEGGPAERVKERGTGWIMSEVSLAECRRVLQHIVENPGEWEKCANSARARKHNPISEWADCYRSLYLRIGSQTQIPDTAILSLVADQSISAKESWRRAFRRIASTLVHRGIVVLDGLRVRRLIEQLARAVLPTRSIERLRAFRH